MGKWAIVAEGPPTKRRATSLSLLSIVKVVHNEEEDDDNLFGGDEDVLAAPRSPMTVTATSRKCELLLPRAAAAAPVAASETVVAAKDDAALGIAAADDHQEEAVYLGDEHDVGHVAPELTCNGRALHQPPRSPLVNTAPSPSSRDQQCSPCLMMQDMVESAAAMNGRCCFETQTAATVAGIVNEAPSSSSSSVNDTNQEPSLFLRVGIVVEAAGRHFDRSNRLHRERPMRVTSIVEALQVSGVLERCCCVVVMQQQQQQQLESSSSSASSSLLSERAACFLQDEDYFRVHLPGYMQR